MIQKSDTHEKVKLSEKKKTKTFEMKNFTQVELQVYDKKSESVITGALNYQKQISESC